MRIFYISIFSVIAIILLGLIEVILLRYLNKPWWEKRIIKIAAYGLPLFGTVMVIVFGIGAYNQIRWLYAGGMILAVMTFVLEVSLMLSLPISGVVQFINSLFDKSGLSKKTTSQIDNHRRIFLKGTAAALPIISISSGVSGFAHAFKPADVYQKFLYFPNLPDELDNFKILHLSDIHLSQYTNLEDLQITLEDARQFTPDLTLVTGDIADDLQLLPDTIKLLEQYSPACGTFASLGNHEHFRGLNQVIKDFDNSNIPLLVNKSSRVTVKNSQIFIGGIDDPVRMGAKEYAFYRAAIEETLLESHRDDFKILMSHRPDALDFASETGINVVLAGHTHGGQIGMNNRSALESFWPDRYLWGLYRMKNTLLYTSSGAGHWFPFRLGCPTEAPIITLKKGDFSTENDVISL